VGQISPQLLCFKRLKFTTISLGKELCPLIFFSCLMAPLMFFSWLTILKDEVFERYFEATSCHGVGFASEDKLYLLNIAEALDCN